MKSKSLLQSPILFILICWALLPLYSCEDREEISLTPEMEISAKLLAADCKVSVLDNSKKRVNLNSIMTASDNGQIIHAIGSAPSMIAGSNYVNSISYILEVLKVDFIGLSETPESEDSYPFFDLHIRFPESECNTPDYILFEPTNNVLVTFEEDVIHIELLDESLVVKPSPQGNQLLEYESIAQALKDAFEENIITIAVSDFPNQVKTLPLGIGYDKLSFQEKSSQTRTARLTVGISTLPAEIFE